jgi:thymidylate kinase
MEAIRVPEQRSWSDSRVGAALEALDAAGIRWALASGRSGLRPNARDVDLIVDSRDRRQIDRILCEQRFVRRHVRSPNRVYVAYDEADDTWHTLDIADRVRVGPVVVHGRRVLLRRRRPGSLWTLGADDAFWLHMLPALASRTGVAQAAQDDLRRLAPDAGVSSELARLATFWSPRGWAAARIRSAAESGDWAALDAACRDARPRATSPAAGFVDRVRRTGTRSARQIGRALPHHGLALAIIGPDGAGKSTLVASIVERFGLPGHAFYMGLHAPVGDVTGHVPPARRRSFPHRVRRQARRLLRLARTAARAELMRWRGQLVVFDRYTYDADIHWATQTGAGARARRWLVRHAAPRPDLTVLLDVPADVMFARKGEHSPAVLDRRRRLYLELARQRPGFAVVDGTQTPSQVQREVCALAWAAFARVDGAQARR